MFDDDSIKKGRNQENALGAVIVGMVAVCVIVGGSVSALGPWGAGASFLALVVIAVLPQARIIGFALLFAGAVFVFVFGEGVDYWTAQVEAFKRLQFGPIEGLADRWFQWWKNLPFAWGQIGAGLILGSFAGIAYHEWANAPARRQWKEHKRALKPDPLGKVAQSAGMNLVNGRSSATDDGTILGTRKSSAAKIIATDAALNTHMLIAGTTGSGKTVTVSNIVESFITRGLPVIYIDGKGDFDLAKRVTGYAVKNNRPNWLFSMAGQSCKYNPLSAGGFTSKKDRVVELREWTEPHYRKLAERYLQTAFKVLAAAGEPVDILSVTKYLESAQLIKLVRSNVDQIGKEQAEALMAEIDRQKDAEEHIEGIRAELGILAESELGPLFDIPVSVAVDPREDLDDENAEDPETDPPVDSPEPVEVLQLKEVLEQGGVAYLALLPVQFPSLSDLLGKLIVNDLKSCLEPTKPVPFLLVIDEFSPFAGPQVLNLLNQGRSMGVHAVLTVQSVADIGQRVRQNADLFTQQIIANCNLFVVHRMNTSEDAQKFSEIIGTKANMEITTQLGEHGATGLGSARRSRHFLAHPDEIKSLERGEAFFLDKNTNTFNQMKARFSALFREA